MHLRGCSLFTMNVMTLGFLRECGLHPVPMVKGRSKKPCHSKDERSSSLYGGRNHFFVLFLFFCFILFTKERSTVGLQQSCLVCQGKKLGDGMVWELPHPMLEWQDGLSFLPLVAKNSWLIKWAFDPREMEMLGTGFGKRIPPTYMGSSWHWQWPQSLALCLRAEKSGFWWTEKLRSVIYIGWNSWFWMSKMIKDNPSLNIFQFTSTLSLVFQTILSFHSFTYSGTQPEHLELRPQRWPGGYDAQVIVVSQV